MRKFKPATPMHSEGSTFLPFVSIVVAYYICIYPNSFMPGRCYRLNIRIIKIIYFLPYFLNCLLCVLVVRMYLKKVLAINTSLSTKSGQSFFYLLKQQIFSSKYYKQVNNYIFINSIFTFTNNSLTTDLNSEHV